jgi:uncharacterized RDD family membrane protein YckC
MDSALNIAADPDQADVIYIDEVIQASPWSRYWSKMFDVVWTGLVLVILWAALLPNYYPTSDTAESLVGLVGVFLGIIGDSLIQGVFGRNLGGMLAGVRIQHSDGSRLSLGEHMARNLSIWLKGLGLGIPIVTLFTVASAYSVVSKGGRTSWDMDADSWAIRDEGAGIARTTLTAVFYIGLMVLLFSVGAYNDRMARQPTYSTYPDPDVPNPTQMPDATMEAARNEIRAGLQSANRQLPKQIDQITRLDRVSFDGDRTVSRHLSIVKSSGEAISYAEAKPLFAKHGDWQKRLTDEFCKDNDMAAFRLSGFILRYVYSDSDGRELDSFTLPNDGCVTVTKVS